MSDNYQAVYNAVRSSFGGFDTESVIRQAVGDAFYVGNLLHSIASEFETVAHEMQRPFVLLKPTISIDGDMWCVLYGDDLQSGVAGFGKTPERASYDFDKNWKNSELKQAAKGGD